MKVGDEFGGVAEFGGRKPRGFFVSPLVAGPANKVKQLALAPAIDAGVQDFGDFVFGLSVDFYWRRRRLRAIREGVRSCRFELRNMEDRVNGV